MNPHFNKLAIVPSISLAALLICQVAVATETDADRANQFNANFKALVQQSQAGKKVNQEFRKSIDPFLGRASHPKPDTGEGYELKTKTDAEALLAKFEAYPGSSQAALDAYAQFQRCDLALDKPDSKDMMSIPGFDWTAAWDALRMIVYSGEALHLGEDFKVRTISAVRRLLHRENTAPSTLIEAAVSAAMVELLVKKHWVKSTNAETLVKALATDVETTKLKYRNAYKDGREGVVFLRTLKTELEDATPLMKRAEALISQ